MFPDDVVKIDIKPIYFNERRIGVVYIDCEHVNKGKGKVYSRSTLTTEDIVRFIFILDGLSIEPEMMNGSYYYYTRVIRDEDDKPYKIVFCQDHSFSWIGVITLYRIKEKNEN